MKGYQKVYWIGVSILAALSAVWMFSFLANKHVVEAAPPFLNETFIPNLQDGDMEITQMGPDSAFAGSLISYTVWFTNTSAYTITDIQLQDTWNTDMLQTSSLWWERGIIATFEGYTAVPVNAVTDFTHTINMVSKNGAATWWLHPVAPGEGVKLVFTVTVPITLQPALSERLSWGAAGPSRLGNSIVAVAPGYTNSPANPVQTTVVGPLLRIVKSSEGEVAPTKSGRVGRLVTYTVQISNLTADGTTQRSDVWRAENLVVVEKLPAPSPDPLIFITATASISNVAVEYDEANHIITWTFPADYTLMPDQTTYTTFTVRIPHTTVYGPRATYLTNAKDYTLARADGMPLFFANAQAAYAILIISPFDKEVTTEPLPAGENETYPDRVITYTMTFYNPLFNTALSGWTLTDDVYETFIVSDVVDGLMPDVISTTQLIWQNVAVPPNGVISATYRVTVSAQTMPNMRVLNSTCSTGKYSNALLASSGTPDLGDFIGHNNNQLALVNVVSEIRISKTAVPATQIYGELVTYTIKLQNDSPRDIPGPFVVTDVLPLFTSEQYFDYYDMVDPAALPGEPYTVTLTDTGVHVVWNTVPTITAGSSFEFSFRAIVDGETTKGYNNKVAVYNDHTAICPFTGTGAKVTVVSPFRIDKTPSVDTVVQGETFYYTATLTHAGPRGEFPVVYFADILTPIMFSDVTDGDSLYTYIPDPPPVLSPQMSWEHTFYVTATGDGWNTPWCNDLASNAVFEQDKETVVYGISETTTLLGIHYNADTLAPVTVLPHVSILQEVFPTPVGMSQTMTFTLVLRDNRTHPSSDVTGVDLQWVLSSSANGSFAYINSTPPVDLITGTTYTWLNLTVPAGGETRVEIILEAPRFEIGDNPVNYTSEAKVVGLDDPSICIPPLSTSNNIKVVRGIKVNKTPSPNEVGPYGEVIYSLGVENQTGAPVKNVVLTDVLPLDWEYVDIVAGPEPVTTTPPVWVLTSIPTATKVTIKFKARAYVWFRTEINTLEWDAPIDIGYTTNYTDKVGVTVRPGIGFFKDVEPRAVNAGESVIYTVTLHNAETFRLDNIVITDVLPSGFIFLETLQMPDGTQEIHDPLSDPQVVKWQLPNYLNSNAAYKIVFRAIADPDLFTGDYYNYAQVFAKNRTTGNAVDIPDTGQTARVHVKGLPVVRINKEAMPASITAGEEVTYTLSLFNEADEAYSIIVTDTLPYNFSFVGMLTGPAPTAIITGSPEKIRWSGVNIASQETLTWTFRVRAGRATESESYCNQSVQVKMGTLDPAPPADNLACVNVTQLPRVDAQLGKDDEQLWIAGGQTLVYTLNYTNSTEDAITLHNVVLTESITPLTAVTVLGGDGWQQVAGLDVFTYHVGTLAPNAAREATFTVRVNTPLPENVFGIRNRAEIGYTLLDDAVEIVTEDNIATDVDFLSILSKEVAPQTILAGQRVIYTVTLHNPDIADWTDLVFTDTLPLNFAYIEQLSGPGIPQVALIEDRIQLTWQVPGPLASDEALTFVFVAEADVEMASTVAYNQIEAHAHTSSGSVLPILSPGLTAPVTVYALPGADKRVQPTNPDAGQEVTYTITLSNPTPLEYEVTVTDTLPATITFVAPVAGPVSPTVSGTPARIVWPGVTLPPLATVTLIFRAQVLPGAAGTLCNALALETENVTRHWDALACVTIGGLPQVDARVSKTDGVSQVTAGQTVTYTIYYTNASEINLLNVTLTDTLIPANGVATLVSTGWQILGLGRYGYNVGTVNAGGAGSVALVVKLADALPAGTLYVTNTVAIGYTLEEPAEEANPDDNVATDVDQVVGDLSISKSVFPQEVGVGQLVTYTINVHNHLLSTLINIMVTDTLPSGFTYEGMVSSQGEPIVDGNTLYWSIANDLPSMETLQVVFRARVGTGLKTGDYANYAGVDAVDGETSSRVLRTVGPAAFVRVIGEATVVADKTVFPSSVQTGEWVTYTISLRNETTQTQTLWVTDTLPQYFAFAAAVAGPVVPTTATLSGGRVQVFWPEITVASAQTVTLVFRSQVSSQAVAGAYCNDVATLITPPAQHWSNLACVEVTEPSLPQVDAQISKSNGVNWLHAGQRVTYTLYYTNASSIPLQNVVLTETITSTAYLTILEIPGGSWQPVGTHYVLEIGSVGAGASGIAQFVVQLSSEIPTATILSVANQVSIDYTPSEPAIEVNLDNNVAWDVDGINGPDLVVKGLRVVPASPGSGQPVEIYVTVANEGNMATERWDGSSDWWLFVTGVYLKRASGAAPPTDVFDHEGQICNAWIPELQPDESGEYYCWPWTPTRSGNNRLVPPDLYLNGVLAYQDVDPVFVPGAGYYKIYAQADANWHSDTPWGQAYGLIEEAVESNNIAGPWSLTVTGSHTIYLPLILRH
ncbi:MAG: DUF11 domain-containing protein [Anaerolineae bacterium]|nr:DUF11 domain-containing protein [Anaerolineae bacterium]